MSAIPVKVIFTSATSFDEAVADWRSTGSSKDYNPHRFRVVVGKDNRVLKDNTGHCRADDGTFQAPVLT